LNELKKADSFSLERPALNQLLFFKSRPCERDVLTFSTILARSAGRLGGGIRVIGFGFFATICWLDLVEVAAKQ
jgi:hypothetical protein